MIAYNRSFLDNLLLIKKSKEWHRLGLLSAEKAEAVADKYKCELYTPSVFIKTGLFLFTILGVGFSALIYSLMFFVSSGDMGFEFYIIFSSLLFSGLCLGALELLIKRAKIFHSGIDEALLYMAVSLLFTAIVVINGFSSDDSSSVLFYPLAAFPVLAFALLRYGDRLIAMAEVFCIYAVFFLLLVKTGDMAKVIIPPAFMVLSACIYFTAIKLKNRKSLIYWRECITLFECSALVVFYFSSNYFVIRESGVLFFNLNLESGGDIPFAVVFYFLTAVVPLLYIYYGLKRKDQILLRSGLVLTAAAAITFKYYFSFGSPEMNLIIAGLSMVAIAYSLIKYLKVERRGITFDKGIKDDRLFKTLSSELIESACGDPEEQI